jgi:hypothetical protein
MSNSKPVKSTKSINYLHSAIKNSSAALGDIPILVKRLIKEDAWRVHYVAKIGMNVIFESFSDFVRTPFPKGLGINVNDLKNLCRNDPEAIDLINQLLEKPKHGGDRRSDKFICNIVTYEKLNRGNSRDNALEKLRDRRPDLHEKVISNEITPHGAMIEAGLRKKVIQIPYDIKNIASALKRKFSQAEIDELVNILSVI